MSWFRLGATGALCLFFLAQLSACGGSTTSVAQSSALDAAQQAPSEAATKDRVGATGDSLAMQIRQEQGQVVLDIPVAAETEVAADYTHPDFVLQLSSPLPAMSVPRPETDLLQAVRIGATRQQVRLELTRKIQFLLSRPEAGRLQVLLVPREAESMAQSASPQQAAGAKLEEVRFSETESGELAVSVEASGVLRHTVRDSSASSVEILFPDLKVPQHLAKLYRLEKFNAPVRSALMRQVEDGALLTCALSAPVPFRIQEDTRLLRILFDQAPLAGKETEPADFTPKESSSTDRNEMDYMAGEPLFPGMDRNYSGETISIDLQDADVEHVLRLLASMADKNLIIDEGVQGSISLKLEEVPWDQALDLVLLQSDLGMVERGNIIRIAPANTLAEERERIRQARQKALEAQQKIQELEPLQTEFIQINYTTASALRPQLQEFLSERGRIGQDARTNTLIVSDTRDNIRKVRSVIDRLDRPEPQVLIEARIVYAKDAFKRSLGVSLAGEYYDDVGAVGQYEKSLSAGVLQGFTPEVSTVNMQGALDKISGIDLFELDAQLKLGELKGVTKTISSPRLVTLNNQQAEISQGIKIANESESESGGTDIEYTEATLKLAVQPQITPDDKVILDLDIADDSPTENGEDIETRTARTKLLVENQETVVLGGVYQVIENNEKNQVPGLGDVPLLGWLFKTDNVNNENRELLIFIRPTILE
ncbi:type IV pilus secretin PilQ [Desulfohalobium retbaense]|nr:type IV pilus secretin PilQ [Desulfohalobium retbaense]